MDFNYFTDGLSHFFSAIIFLLVYLKIRGGRPNLGLPFLLGTIISSSSIFFVPVHLKFLGQKIDYYYQFFHYPLSDWDILIFGSTYHRSFLTHSFLLLFPAFPMINKPVLNNFFIGLCIGLSSHLFWDSVSSSYFTKIVFTSGVFIMGWYAKVWLLINALIVFSMALMVKFLETK